MKARLQCGDCSGTSAIVDMEQWNRKYPQENGIEGAMIEVYEFPRWQCCRCLGYVDATVLEEGNGK